MAVILDDDLTEYYRQRGRWFLLLGVLLGGIITLTTAFAFVVQEWGNRISVESGGGAYQIAVGLAVGLVLALIVVALTGWRAATFFQKAHKHEQAARAARQRSEPVAAAVSAWAVTALSQHSHDDSGPSNS